MTEAAEATQDQVKSVAAKDVRKGGYVLLKDRPCKVVEASVGKDSVHVVGIDVFTGKKYEDIVKATENLQAPVVTHTDFQLIDIDGDSMTLLNDDGETKELPLSADEDVKKEILAKYENGETFLVTVVSATGKEEAVGTKLLSK
ncbi:translation initiation factor IF-5A [Streptomyces sp. NPDC055051]